MQSSSEDSEVWVFHPQEPIRLCWDLIITVVLLYVLIFAPLTVCFEMSEGSIWGLIELVVCAIFMCDIIWNFNTGYIKNSRFISSRRMIAAKYLRGWFCIDVITSLPYDQMSIGSERHGAANKVGTVLKMLKLLRIARVVKLKRQIKQYSQMAQWEDNSATKASLNRLLEFLFVIFIIAHFAACLWVGIANYYRSPIDRSYENNYGYHEMSWIVRNSTTQEIWAMPPSLRYLFALYWAITTLTTVGYGDITAYLPLEHILAMTVQICGTGLSGYIIANLASVVAHEDAIVMMIKSKINSVRMYMRYRNFPDELSKKIARHYEYSWKRNQVYKESNILMELPQATRTACALYIHKDLIEKVPFLQSLGKDVLPSLVIKLKSAIAAYGDVVVQEGLFGHEMYLVSEGDLRICLAYSKNAKDVKSIPIRNLTKGEYFAEYAVIMDQAKHPASVKAVTYCDLFVLSQADFQEFGQDFPDVYNKVIKMSKRRYLDLTKEINRKRQQYMMDLGYKDWCRKNPSELNSNPNEANLEEELEQTIENLKAKLVHRRASVVSFGMRMDYQKNYKQLMLYTGEKVKRKRLKRIQVLPKVSIRRNGSKVYADEETTRQLRRQFSKRSECSGQLPVRINNTSVEFSSDASNTGELPPARLPCAGNNTKFKPAPWGVADKKDPRISLNLRPVLNQVSSRLSQKSTKLEPPPDTEPTDKNTMNLSLFSLFRIQAWKNHAQLQVAMRGMDAVERRHVQKFSLYQGQNPETIAKKRPISAKDKGAPSFQKVLAEKLAYYEKVQVETQQELKDLHALVESLQRQLFETNQTLSNVASLVSKNLNSQCACMVKQTDSKKNSYSVPPGSNKYGVHVRPLAESVGHADDLAVNVKRSRERSYSSESSLSHQIHELMMEKNI